MPGTARGDFGFEVRLHLIARNELCFAALEVVVAAIELFPQLRQSVEVTGHGNLHKLLFGAASFGCQPIQPLLHFGCEMKFHQALKIYGLHGLVSFDLLLRGRRVCGEVPCPLRLAMRSSSWAADS